MKLLLQKYLIRVRRLETFTKTFLLHKLLVKTNTTIVNVDQHVMRKVCLTSSMMFTVIKISSKSLQLISVSVRLICDMNVEQLSAWDEGFEGCQAITISAQC